MAKNDWNNKTYDYEYAPGQLAFKGKVVQEPEVFSGKSTVVRMRIAMNSRVRESDRKIRNQSTFLTVTAFDIVAENIINLGIDKGSELIIIGRLSSNNYENKEGELIYGLQVKAEDVGISVLDRGLQDSDYAPKTGGYTNNNSDDEEDDEESTPRRTRKKSSRSSGAKRRSRSRDEDVDDVDDIDEDVDDIDDEDDEEFEPKPRRSRAKRNRRKVEVDDDIDDYLEDDDEVI